MEYESVEDLHDENSLGKEEIEDDGKHVPGAVPGSSGNNILVNMAGWERGGIAFESEPIPEETSGEINMEACITTDYVIRAGGFGARDDISCFLPVASNSTDFEETILDAKNYEEPQEEKHRPGLGWKEATDGK